MSSVLLLDVGFQPLAVINQRRALSLIMAVKAEPIEGEETVISSISRTFILSSVIRLRYYVRAPIRHAHWSKINVLRRDQYVCQFCGTKLSEAQATVDHIVSLSECRKKSIHPNTWSNTAASCVKCQKRKGDRSMHEAGMKFYNPTFEPKSPRVNYLVLVLQNSQHEEWRKYVRV
jgi:5-methylcytosine-specific restriction endonuclease McrA